MSQTYPPSSRSPVSDTVQDSAANLGPDPSPQQSLEDFIEQQELLVGSGQRPRPTYVPPLAITLLRNVPDSALAVGVSYFNPQRVDDPEDDTKEDLFRAFRLFAAEWDAYLGSDPLDPIPPAAVLVADEEARVFLHLFPYVTGHYQGPKGHNPPMTFEQYAFMKLQNMDSRFRDDPQWLTWALTCTTDRKLSMAINCILCVKHDQKARHLGSRQLQTLPMNEEFVGMEMEGKNLKPLATPRSGSYYSQQIIRNSLEYVLSLLPSIY